MMMNHGFVQTVNTPTRGHNILDVLLPIDHHLVVSCDVLPGISDHKNVHIKDPVQEN